MPEIVVPKAPAVKNNGSKAWYFQEGFEGAWLPTGWDSARVSGTYATYLQHVTTGVNPTCSPHGGSYMVCWYSYLAPDGDRMRVFTPPINISCANDSLSFWMVHDPGYSGYTERIVIEVMSKPSGG